MASNSNSQTPSNLSPTRYFDLLPTELLRDIFKNLDEVPRTRESQRTLLSLCLTSKLCRSHAQPLLLKTIHTSIGNYPGLLQKLVENIPDASISMTERFHFDTQDLKNIKKWLVKFIKKATNLREVSVMKQVTPLKAFFGSNITTLSLESITMKLDGAVLSLPELLKLSLDGCPIHNDGGIHFSLPKLRHFAFFWQSSAHLYRPEYELIDGLAPQLVSFTISLIKLPNLPPSILTSRTLSTLYEVASYNDVLPMQGVCHLLLRLHSQHLENWVNVIKNSTHQLETLTLTKKGGANRTTVGQNVVQDLVAACKSRDIEVVWDQQGTRYLFDDLVPASFVRRSEARHSGIKAKSFPQD
ncbi:hypothetical protein JCM3765_003492 [Sporobolomyces pararoseus]